MSEMVCGRKRTVMAGKTVNGRLSKEFGVTMVHDRLGKLYSHFPYQLAVGSISDGVLGGLDNSGLDGHGHCPERLRILREVHLEEVRAAMGTDDKLAAGYWYEVMTD